MTRCTTEYFICDCCKIKQNSMELSNITIFTKKDNYFEKSFCSFLCFKKYFNNAMKENKTGVELQDDS